MALQWHVPLLGLDVQPCPTPGGCQKMKTCLMIQLKIDLDYDLPDMCTCVTRGGQQIQCGPPVVRNQGIAINRSPDGSVSGQHPFFSTLACKEKTPGPIFSSRRWPHLMAAPFLVQMYWDQGEKIAIRAHKSQQSLQVGHA